MLRGLAAGRLPAPSRPLWSPWSCPPWPRSVGPSRHRSVLGGGSTPALLEQVPAGDVDVAVVSAPPDQPIDPAGLNLATCAASGFVAVPADHRLSRRRTVRLSELDDEFFLAGSATAEEALLRARLPPEFRPKVDIVVADWTGKLGCVAAGLGVALLPALAARAVPPEVILLRLHPDDAPDRLIFAATATACRRPAAERFLPFLRQAVADTVAT